MARLPILTLALVATGSFLLSTWIQKPASRSSSEDASSQVVIPAAIQLALYGGDRYLAANIESIRSAAEGMGVHETDLGYIIRLRNVVAQLNACHEDNYYLGNAQITWSGASREGSQLLLAATDCRYWDEYPPFFHGVNQYFFAKDNQEARRALEIAANRSTHNAASFRKLAIMIAAEELDDAQLALEYLRHQRDTARDDKLKQMLNKRVVRLEGLIKLREAQAEFENRFGKTLESPQQLLDSGILEVFPDDPLRLGYQFSNHEFILREKKITGLEDRQ